nr:SpoIID/LytB domain-containing protein [Clostridium caldaquaticum]
MGNVTSLDFTVTNDYFVQNENIILKSGKSYKIDIADSIFKLYENNSLLLQTNNNITIKPTVLGSFIRFVKNTYTRNFPGSITFKNNGSFFIPINTLKIEDYVKGVLPFEMDNSFPIEALKAQAIAARTYGIANKGSYSSSGYDLRDDVYSQVYRGIVTSASNANKAVDETQGIVLTYNGSPISALFSSSNGGFTEKSGNVWSTNYPYFVDEADPFDLNESNPRRSWSASLTVARIDEILKQEYPNLNIKQFVRIDIENIKKYVSGRISELRLIYLDNNDVEQAVTVNKDKVRTLFGLNSAMYSVNAVKDPVTQTDVEYTFNGSGWGHGVGMSQWGAYGRANANQNYTSILNFYYRNTLLENAFTNAYIARFKQRIGGENRYSTSRMIAEKVNSGQVNAVVLATGKDFPDALSGAVLAKKVGGPILLVDQYPSSEDSKEALNYISSHLSKSGTIYLLGGEGVISPQYVSTLTSMGFSSSNIIRLGGINRQETALQVASNVSSGNTPVVIATENDFPDALSISSIAALRGWPILLTNKDNLSTQVENFIKSRNPEKVYIVGETGVVSDSVKNKIKQILNAGDSRVIRIGGVNRYETSRLISSTFIPDTEEVVLATGKNYPDALSGSVYAAMNGSPIILVDDSNMSDAEKYLRVINYNGSYPNLVVLGKSGAVSDKVVNYLTNLK